MSDYSDCDVCSCAKEVIRKARKQHKCCECGNVINIGENYQYVSGIWDGEPSSYKTCESCSSVRDSFIALPENETAIYSELACEISDSFCRGFGINEYSESTGIDIVKLKKLFGDDYD
jgi:hypothetical protein